MSSLAKFAILLAAAGASPVKRATDGFDPTGTVAPDTINDCTYWVNTETGDTCQTITGTYGIDAATLIQYNPSINGDCSGLKIGNSYCIEVNYGLGPPASTTSTTSKSTSKTSTTTSSSSPTTSSGPSPTQSGIVDDCTTFYKVVAGDGCYDIVQQYGTFTLEDFYSWNPALNDDCSGLLSGYYVCVGVPGTPTAPPTSSTPTPTGPSPTQPGIVDNCVKYYQAKSGDSCYSIADDFGTFTVMDFTGWNPAVGDDCSGLYLDYYYCIAVPGTPTVKPTSTASPTPTGPSPTQSGIVDNCTKYYKSVSGDTCDTIASKFGTFTTNKFISWNPAVQSDCSKLFLGYYYCVSVPGTPTKPISTSSPTPTPKGPQPQQPGVTQNCRKYHKVVSGDNCYNIEQAQGITAAQFNRWNPSVGSDCQSLYAGYYVCVGV